jgi:hypothetical protein
VAGLSGKKAIEDAAIQWFMSLERAAGRRPRDTRYDGARPRHRVATPADQVKSFGISNRGYDLWLEVRQVEEAKTNPGTCFTSRALRSHASNPAGGIVT